MKLFFIIGLSFLSLCFSLAQSRVDLAVWDFSDLSVASQLPPGQLNSAPYPANSGLSKSTALLGTEQMFDGTTPVTRTWSAPSATNYIYCNKAWTSDGSTWYQLDGISTVNQTNLQFSSSHASSSSSAPFTFQLQYRISATSEWISAGNPIVVNSSTSTNGLVMGYDRQLLPEACEGIANLQLRLLCVSTASASAQARIDNIMVTAAGEPGTGGDVNDPIPYAEALNEADWGVPDWTKMLAALRKAKSNASNANLENLKSVLLAMKPGDVPYSVNAVLNDDPTTHIGLAWYTNEGVTGGVAQIVAKANAVESDFDSPFLSLPSTTFAIQNTNYLSSGNSSVSSATGLSSGVKRSYISNKVLVTGLLPNTTYSYRVGKENAWSNIRSFKTADAAANDFSFIYITDTQANTEDNFNVSKRTLESAFQQVQNPSFVLVNGDLVESRGGDNSEWEYEQWFEKMSPVLSQLPMVVTSGNHDISPNLNLHRHVNTSLEFDQNYLTANSTMPGMTYSFVMGDALIFVVNFEDAGSKLYMALDQYMSATINNYPDTKWRIMFYHNSMYTGGNAHHDSSTSRDIRNAFSYFMNKHRINLALHGHSHVYEVIGPVRHADKTLISSAVSMIQNAPVAIPSNMNGKQGGVFDVSEGTLFFLNNSAGKKKYTPLTQTEMLAEVSSTGIADYWSLFSGKYGQTGDPTFSDVKVTSDTIFIATYSVSDTGVPTMYDSFKVVKNINANTSVDESLSSLLPFNYHNEDKKIVLNPHQIAKIEIYSSTAQLVSSAIDVSELSVASLKRGVYIARVSSAEGISVKKIFIQ